MCQPTKDTLRTELARYKALTTEMRVNNSISWGVESAKESIYRSFMDYATAKQTPERRMAISLFLKRRLVNSDEINQPFLVGRDEIQFCPLLVRFQRHNRLGEMLTTQLLETCADSLLMERP